MQSRAQAEVNPAKELFNVLTKVEIVGKVFHEYGLFKMRQIYNNVNSQETESVYKFKLPHNAIVKSMKIQNNSGDTIVAKIAECWEAQRHYDEGIAAGHSVITMECLGNDTYTVTIGRHMRGTQFIIEVEYFYEFGDKCNQSRLIIPLVYLPAPSSGADGAGADLWTDKTDYSAGIDIEIIDIDEVKSITSPTHEITVNYDGVFPKITLLKQETVMDRDFVVDIEYNETQPDKVYAYKNSDGSGIAYYSLNPDIEDVSFSKPENIIFILDATSTMLGDKMRRAKTALWLSLKELDDTQQFNIYAVNDKLRPFSYNIKAADSHTIDGAINWLEKLDCDNGTSILDALFEVSDGIENRNGTHIVIMTDGRTNQQFEIKKYLSKSFKDIPVSVFGFDAIMEKDFLSSMAQITGGQAVYIYPEEKLDAKIRNAFKAIFSPCVEGVSVTPLWAKIKDVFPQIFTKVVQGDRLMFLAAFEDILPLNIALSNKDEQWKKVITVENVKEYSSFELLDYAFNMNKIKFLQRFLPDLSENVQSKVINEITEVAMSSGILCDRTTFCATDEHDNRKKIPLLFKKAVPLQKSAFLEELSTDTFFNESLITELKTVHWRSRIIEMCSKVILKAQRKNGCIAPIYEYDKDDCAISTAMCAIAILLYAKNKEKFSAIINGTTDFLLDYADNGGILTSEIMIALKMSLDSYIVTGDKMSRAQKIINSFGGQVPQLYILKDKIGNIDEVILKISECTREEEAVTLAAKCVILLNIETKFN